MSCHRSGDGGPARNYLRLVARLRIILPDQLDRSYLDNWIEPRDTVLVAESAYSPDEAIGDRACPFTTLYWDFLARHRSMLEENRRMGFQVKNLERKSGEELERIRERAGEVLGGLARY